jgi:hypothetical protein
MRQQEASDEDAIAEDVEENSEISSVVSSGREIPEDGENKEEDNLSSKKELAQRSLNQAYSEMIPEDNTDWDDENRGGTSPGSKRPKSKHAGRHYNQARQSGVTSSTEQIHQHMSTAHNLVQTGIARNTPQKGILGMSRVEAIARLSAVKDLLRGEIDQLSKAVDQWDLNADTDATTTGLTAQRGAKHSYASNTNVSMPLRAQQSTVCVMYAPN